MTSTRSRTRQKSPPRRSRWLGWLWKLGLVALVILAGFTVYLDAQVQSKFSGKRWTLPAKVYARPLELYAGVKLKQEDFLHELEALGYRKEPRVTGPGSVSVAQGTVEFNTRGFQFYEGEEQARQVRVRFSNNRVAALTQPDGNDLAVVRLEPLLIGGMYPAHSEDRVLIKLDQVPMPVIDTLLAVEDRNFWNHWGVSIRSVARAMWANFTAGRLVQGGSTLTQQLVKNFFLTNERSLSRKSTEAIMSVLLEWHYDKNEILEAYMNEVFLGQDGERAIHGFGLASHYYFSRPLEELNLEQIALLVGMVRGPSYYNPRRHLDRALARRNLVLDILVEQNLISQADADIAKQRPLGVTEKGSLADSSYPAFLDLVKRQLKADYRDEDLTEEGLRIFTSFDPILQLKAENALNATLKRLDGRPGVDQVEAAMVVTNPETGEIQALLGSRDSRFAGFNRAVDAVRQIGSLMKPVVYLSALERPSRFTLTTILEDEPVSIKGQDGKVWTPKNFDRQSHGSLPLYQCLMRSYNLSTVRLGMDVGVPEVLKTVERLGVNRDWPAYPSILLGAGSMTPMEVATLYQTIASGGFNTPLRAIRSVLTVDGEPLKRYPFQVEQRFNAGAVYLLQSAMERVMREGTGRSVYNQLPGSLVLAGKTGTTNDLRDSWFAGFGRDLLAVVWLGRDDYGITPLTGATGALQVWTGFMAQANPLSLEMQMPENVVQAWVDKTTGLGSNADCANAVKMPYIRGSEPQPVMGCGGTSPGSVMDWVRGWLN